MPHGRNTKTSPAWPAQLVSTPGLRLRIPCLIIHAGCLQPGLVMLKLILSPRITTSSNTDLIDVSPHDRHRRDHLHFQEVDITTGNQSRKDTIKEAFIREGSRDTSVVHGCSLLVAVSTFVGLTYGVAQQ